MFQVTNTTFILIQVRCFCILNGRGHKKPQSDCDYLVNKCFLCKYAAAVGPFVDVYYPYQGSTVAADWTDKIYEKVTLDKMQTKDAVGRMACATICYFRPNACHLYLPDGDDCLLGKIGSPPESFHS